MTENQNGAPAPKTHWKKLHNPDYLGAYSLDEGKDLTVTIESVGKETVTGSDGKKEECTVARLRGQKPMILNSTNCKTIAKLYGTPYIEDWRGKPITLYAAKVNAFGEQVEALRIRAVIPKGLPELTPAHEKWEIVRTSLKNGTATIEQARTRFFISDANYQLLIKKDESQTV